MRTLNIGRDFSCDPAGRYRTDGDASGEAFREDFLRKEIEQLKKGEKLKIILDDCVEAYGSSFLTEGFAGMVKYGYISSNSLLKKLDITYADEDFKFYAEKIQKYILDAKYNSQKYEKV